MIISIEGNIGSGKSTLIQALKEYFKDNKKILFLKEPVDQWELIKDKQGTTMLEKFYNDKEKYSFAFQMMAYISRLSLIKEAYKNDKNIIIITERSLQTDKFVFAQMLYDADMMEKVEYDIYMKWFNHFVEDYDVKKIIYVNASPDKCLERVTKRSRAGEAKIELEYLNNCDKYHHTMLNHFSDDTVFKLNGNQDLDPENNVMNGWINSIENIINPLIL